MNYNEELLVVIKSFEVSTASSIWPKVDIPVEIIIILFVLAVYSINGN